MNLGNMFFILWGLSIAGAIGIVILGVVVAAVEAIRRKK